VPKSRYKRVGRTLRGKRLYENVQVKRRKKRKKPVAKRSRKTPARRNGGGGLAKKGLGMKLGAAAVGAVAAQTLPGVGQQISDNIPITWGAVLGLVLIMNRRSSEMVKYAGFGMVLGGGVVQYAETLIGPQLADLGARPAGS
jgi:hypothetical protein